MAKRKAAAQPQVVRLGNQEVIKIGVRSGALNDPYHFVLTLSWPRFFALVLVFFLATNILFATLYGLSPGSVSNARAGAFLDYFFFSVETLATVGYGEMAPGSIYGHTVASVEIFLGMISLAVVTGLIFFRFAKPTARILFSHNLLVREFEGQQTLMLRAANERHNRIVEAEATLGLVREETTAFGETFFRLYDLPLVRSRSQVFSLTWTFMHRIDASSPLFGWSKEALEASGARITVSITGHDETMADAVHALHSYPAERLLYAYRFADIILPEADGRRVIDLRRFHDVEPYDIESSPGAGASAG